MNSLIYILFPLFCVAAIPPASGKGGMAQRLVFGIALYQFLLFVTGITLGLTQQLTTQAYTLATAGAALVLLVRSLDHPFLASAWPAHRRRRGAGA